MRDDDLDGQQVELQEESWKFNGFLCVFFLHQIWELNNCNNLLHGVSSQWSEQRSLLHLVPGPLQMKDVQWLFLWYMTTDSNACSRASLFHKSYYSTRSDPLNLSKLFTYVNGRNFDAWFPHSVPQFTNRKLWKHETRNQSFGVGVFFVCVCVYSW